MGEGCIDLRGIRAMVEQNGFHGMIGGSLFQPMVEETYRQFLQSIQHAYLHHT